MSAIDPFATGNKTLDGTIPRAGRWFQCSVLASQWRKITLRQILLKLHLYISLWLGVFLVLAGLTGSLLVYEHALDKALNAELMVVEPRQTPPHAIAEMVAAANGVSPIKTAPSHLQLPAEADDALIVRYQVPAEPGHKGHNHHFHEVMVNPYTGQVLGDRDRFNTLMSIILKLHYSLLSGDSGKLLMGITAVLTVILTITGIYLWWPKLSKIKQAFVIKRNASFTRFNFDLHKTVGIYTAVVMLSVSLSGVYFNLPQLVKPVVNLFSPLEGMLPPVTSESDTGEVIAPEKALEIAKQTLPGITLQRLYFPSTAKGSYQVSARQADESRSKGATKIWIDAYSGKVLKIRDPHQFAAGDAFINLQLPLHNGEIAGQFGRILVLIAGFAPLILMVTGIIHWLKKRRSRAIHNSRIHKEMA